MIKLRKISYEYVVLIKEYAEALKESAKKLEKQINALKKNSDKIDVNSYKCEFENIDGKNVLVKKMENASVDSLKDLADNLVEQKENSVVIFALVSEGKIVFICKNKVASLKAGDLVKKMAVITGGNGGGRGDFAQAGGKDVSKLDDAIKEIIATIKESK